jgi:hypothetical protein
MISISWVTMPGPEFTISTTAADEPRPTIGNISLVPGIARLRIALEDPRICANTDDGNIPAIPNPDSVFRNVLLLCLFVMSVSSQIIIKIILTSYAEILYVITVIVNLNFRFISRIFTKKIMRP